MVKNHYSTLNVTRNASQDDIRQAYRRLARLHHPDVNKSPFAEERFKTLGEAYEVLGNPDKRAEYDEESTPSWMGTHTRQGTTDFQGKSDPFSGQNESVKDGFSKFFHNFRTNRAARANKSGQPRTTTNTQHNNRKHASAKRNTSNYKPGGDLEARLPLTLEAAADGGIQEVSLYIPELDETKTFYVNVPQGVRDNHRIQLKGHGFPGSGTTPAGDLHLTVELQPHPYFRLEGWDIYAKVPITPWEAALGDKVKLKTLDGKVKIRIPEGSSSGRKIRLRGKGFPTGHKDTRGDLFYELSIVIPESLTLTEKRLFKKLADKSSFEPRD
ncbi:MAG: DnaJ domain-containing protein [Magnetococcales bacterium]|nr:DnaJ domain-containing protein [Magnetococcales bacterium]